MSNPQLLYDLHRMRLDELRRDAAIARLAATAPRSGPRLEARVLLPLADHIIALGLRLRGRYQPGESLALVPIAHPSGSAARPSGVAGSRADSLVPVLAFQVIQCLPQRTTSLTYWSLIPATTGTPETASGHGLLCLARSLE